VKLWGLKLKMKAVEGGCCHLRECQSRRCEAKDEGTISIPAFCRNIWVVYLELIK